MAITDLKKMCENCHWWRQGDPSAQNIGNVGLCTWMLPRTRFGEYKDEKHAPYWATETAHRTTSYEGQSCGTYQKKR